MHAVGTWHLDEDKVLKGLEICIMQSRDPIITESVTQASASVIIGLGYTRPLSDAAVRLLRHSQNARFAPYANVDSTSEQVPGETISNVLRDSKHCEQQRSKHHAHRRISQPCYTGNCSLGFLDSNRMAKSRREIGKGDAD